MAANFPYTARSTCFGSRVFDSHIIDRVSFVSDGFEIVGWVMRPSGAGPYPVIIYNHGSRVSPKGKANLDQPTLSFATKPWRGVSTGKCLIFFPEGRGYAGSEGLKLTDCNSEVEIMSFLQGRADDVHAGVDWLDAQSWADTSRIGMTGCSHGAVVSLLAAPAGRCCSVIAQAPGASIIQPPIGMEQMVEAVLQTDARIVLQHAVDDILCPVEISRTLYRRGKQAGRDISLQEFPAMPGIEGHAQFNFENRAIWGAEFDAALTDVVGGKADTNH